MNKATEGRPIYDYLRVLAGCLNFLWINPLLKLLFSFVPEGLEWILSGLAMAAGAAVSWLLFNIVDLRSTFTFTWSDAIDGNTFPGDTVDLHPQQGDSGRIVFIQLERKSRTAMARRVFSWLLSKGFYLAFSANQGELRFTEERENSAVSVDAHQVSVEIAEPAHATTVVTFDLGLRWEGVFQPEVLARLKYEPRFSGGWWVKIWVSLLVDISPSVKAIRKVQAHV